MVGWILCAIQAKGTAVWAASGPAFQMARLEPRSIKPKAKPPITPPQTAHMDRDREAARGVQAAMPSMEL